MRAYNVIASIFTICIISSVILKYCDQISNLLLGFQEFAGKTGSCVSHQRCVQRCVSWHLHVMIKIRKRPRLQIRELSNIPHEK